MIAEAPYIFGRAVSIYFSVGAATFASFIAWRSYSKRSGRFKFGVVGTIVLLVLVWIAVFVTALSLSTNAWSNI